jgi:hypothetical protein
VTHFNANLPGVLHTCETLTSVGRHASATHSIGKQLQYTNMGYIDDYLASRNLRLNLLTAAQTPSTTLLWLQLQPPDTPCHMQHGCGCS